jgi:hypothetical protein
MHTLHLDPAMWIGSYFRHAVLNLAVPIPHLTRAPVSRVTHSLKDLFIQIHHRHRSAHRPWSHTGHATGPINAIFGCGRWSQNTLEKEVLIVLPVDEAPRPFSHRQDIRGLIKRRLSDIWRRQRFKIFNVVLECFRFFGV